MAVTPNDVVPLNQVRARLTELAEEAREGREKLITRNGEAYVALVDARRLDHYHRLAREHIHINLMDEAIRGLEELNAGQASSVQKLRARYRARKR